MGGPDDGEGTTSETDVIDEFLPEEGTRDWGRASPGIRWRRGVGNALMAFGVIIGLLAVVYVVDLVAGIGDVPRGVTVAGVDIGGLDKQEAEAELRRELGPRVTRPVELRAAGIDVSLDPVEAGLGVDWTATVEQAGGQPWLPWDRLAALFGGREVPLVTTVEEKALKAALDRVARERVNRPALDGGIVLRPVEGEHDDGGVSARVIEPKAGTRMTDLDAAVAAVRAHWPSLSRIELPVEVLRPRLTSEAVHAVLEDTVRPLLDGPVLVRGDGAESVLLPEDIHKALGFEIRDDGGSASLAVTLDHAVLSSAVRGELGPTERPARDAALVFRNGAPVVVPSVRGTRIDWERTFAGMTQTLATAPPDQREIMVLYDAVEPAVTTEDIRGLGIEEIVATTTASGHAPADLAGADVAAGQLSGVVVRPGETLDPRAYGAPPPLAAALEEAGEQAGLSVGEGGILTNDTKTAVAVDVRSLSSTVRVTLWGSHS
ncbi:peptidoglycan binding domain-containing protein [Saccharomonospora glauca]|uniref:Putative vancomycin resistance protein n=1 Tax=Saccharomonospora glauca K62 TaxID=928724 RepID=I1D837_9PSEU|nr:peptidoglycan binding domain-containing protein [Saccharomonospora glauca]EIF01112.1 putative vancomycin resistance protein [Saccharomonospora glauca K62]